MSKEMTSNKTSNLPAHLQNVDANLGNENVSASDQSIPEIKLMQAMSGELKKTSPRYIPDAKLGDIAVGAITYEEIYVINLFYKKEYPIFDDNRTLIGNFATSKEANDYIANNGLNPSLNTVVETATHACLHTDKDGKVLGPAIMRMSSTKLRISNDWNSMLTQTNAPRFASIWKLTPVEQSNAKGSWYNYHIEQAGWADEETFNFAKDQYDSMVSAQKAA